MTAMCWFQKPNKPKEEEKEDEAAAATGPKLQIYIHSLGFDIILIGNNITPSRHQLRALFHSFQSLG